MAWHTDSRHDRGYGYAWTKRRKQVLRRDGYLCRQCYAAGRPTPATDVDHIVPRSLDGTDDFDNLQSLCRDCHKAKTQREAKQAQGATPRPEYDAQGRPIWTD